MKTDVYEKDSATAARPSSSKPVAAPPNPQEIMKRMEAAARPGPAHQALNDLKPGDFSTWLRLFDETAREVCAPEVAALFVERAERIARRLQMGVFPALDDLRAGPTLR